MSNRLAAMVIMTAVVLLGTMFLAPISTMSAFTAEADTMLENVESSNEVGYTNLYVYEGQNCAQVTDSSVIHLHFVNGDSLSVNHSVTSCPEEVLEGIDVSTAGLNRHGQNKEEFSDWMSQVVSSVEAKYGLTAEDAPASMMPETEVKAEETATSEMKPDVTKTVNGFYYSVGNGVIKATDKVAEVIESIEVPEQLSQMEVKMKVLGKCTILTLAGLLIAVLFVTLLNKVGKAFRSANEYIWSCYRKTSNYKCNLLRKNLKALRQHKDFFRRYALYCRVQEKVKQLEKAAEEAKAYAEAKLLEATRANAKLKPQKLKDAAEAKANADKAEREALEEKHNLEVLENELGMLATDTNSRPVQVCREFLELHAYDAERLLAHRRYLGEDGYQDWRYFVKRNHELFIDLAKKSK